MVADGNSGDQVPTDSKSVKALYCSFCGKSQHEVRKLIAGPTVFICDECVALCEEIVRTEWAEGGANKPEKLDLNELTPRSIFDSVSSAVVGQDDAKRTISVAVYLHHLRAKNPKIFELPKSNVLLIGPTGVGKTLLMKSVAEILHVPFVIVSATAYTQAGYVGEDVESMLSFLLAKADGDLQKAQKGIVFIDEIDKIARVGRSSIDVSRDVSGVGVQQALLTLIEGALVNITGNGLKKHPQAEFIHFDTSGVLFVFSGAFTGLDEIVNKRLHAASRILVAAGPKNMGVDDEAERYNSLMHRVTVDDLIEFGFIPEFMGRIGEIAFLAALKKTDLVRIAKYSKKSYMSAYVEFFRSRGVKIEYSEEFVDVVAELAMALHTGARSLKSILDGCFRELMFVLPSRRAISKCIMTREVALSVAKPLIFDDRGRPAAWERDTVFVGYARKDAEYYQEMKTCLIPILRGKKIRFWSDESINAGEDWKDEIGRALSRTKVGFFLVSPDFLASEISVDEELGYLINVQKGEQVEILWVLLNPCMYQHSSLSEIQALHDVGTPLSKMSKADRNMVWVQAGTEILKLLNRQGVASQIEYGESNTGPDGPGTQKN